MPQDKEHVKRVAQTVAELREMVKEYGKGCHLVGAICADRMGAIPEGFRVVGELVVIDPDDDAAVFPLRYIKAGTTPGDDELCWGLSAVSLSRLATAAALNWDPKASGRIGDRGNPDMVEWQAVCARMGAASQRPAASTHGCHRSLTLSTK